MKRERVNRRWRSLLLALAALPFGPAMAVVTLPGGDIYLNGEFEQVNYGSSGLGYVTPFLYVGDLASTESPANTAATTLLSYQYLVSGLGSNQMQIHYSLTNNDPDPFDDLRFIVNVQADGSGSFSDNWFSQWGAKGSGDPDNRQIADFFALDLPASIVANNGLNNSENCALPCDVDMALQWNLDSLLPGQTWSLLIALSDDGSAISSRFLRAASADLGNSSQLTFSGTASVVPIPGALVLMGSAVLGLLGFGYRKKS